MLSSFFPEVPREVVSVGEELPVQCLAGYLGGADQPLPQFELAPRSKEIMVYRSIMGFAINEKKRQLVIL
jgi:hypothetical protein